MLAFEKANQASFHPEAGAPFKPRALYFHVFPNRFLRLVTRIMPIFGANPRKFGRNKDIDLVALTEFHFPTHVKIDISPVARVKAGGRCLSCLAGRNSNAPGPHGLCHAGPWRARELHAGLSAGAREKAGHGRSV